jgi:acyl phosphate:glycerol-3-phosphate acyltransferase
MVQESVVLRLVLTTITAYLLGGVPFGYLFVRFALGKDIRTMGSGNIGATNVHRSAGGKAGVIVLLLDIFKGFLAVSFAGLVTHNNPTAIALAAAAVMIGHSFPVFLRFKGGKAVACCVGAFLYIAPLAVLAIVPVFVLVVAISKHISLASIVSVLLFPLILWLILHPVPPILLAAVFGALLIVYRHKANIQRLMAGNENVFSLRGRRS